MISMSRRVLAAATVAFLTAHAPIAARAAEGADEAAIRAATAAWGKAYNAGDADTIVAYYTPDAVVMPPGSPRATGHDAIRAFVVKDMAGARAAGVTLVISGKSDVGISGDLAWESGTYVVADKAGAAVDSGSFVGIFRKVDGKWLSIRDTWNSDRPAAAAAAAAATAAQPAKK